MDVRLGLRLATTVLFACAWACSADEDEIPDDRFPCGNGSCALTELCIIDSVDTCATCMALPTECEAEQVCGCLDGVDKAAWEFPCADEGTCEPSGEGLLVRCTAMDWGCG